VKQEVPAGGKPLGDNSSCRGDPRRPEAVWKQLEAAQTARRGGSCWAGGAPPSVELPPDVAAVAQSACERQAADLTAAIRPLWITADRRAQDRLDAIGTAVRYGLYVLMIAVIPRRGRWGRLGANLSPP
jgi:hypothetical protein